MITKVNDHIEALVHFKNGNLKPFRFLWKGHPYPINRITTTYSSKNGGVTYLIFSVESAGNLYELIYNSSDHTWNLRQVSTAD